MVWMVLGGGRTGLSVARHLTKMGEDVCLSDPNLAEKDRAALTAYGVKLVVEAQTAVILDLYAVSKLVPSPGISPSHPVVSEARKRHLPILSDVDLALAQYKGDVIAVTGTNGKSTTVAMITHILNNLSQYNATACGNIGYPVLEALENERSSFAWVLELSSYQLAYSQKIRARAVVFTSYSPDHLVWHHNEEDYFSAKWRLVTSNKGSVPIYADKSVLTAARTFNKSLPLRQLIEFPSHARISELATNLAPQLATLHDQQNAWVASKVVSDLYEVRLEECMQTLASFRTLPHRFEWITDINGSKIYNDSKATNVDATCRSLASLDRAGTLLLGGKGKGESFLPILAYSDRINRVICFGESSRQILAELGDDLTCSRYDTLKEALKELNQSWLVGPLLLSPGCASFDEFENFEARGQFFRDFILQYKKTLG